MTKDAATTKDRDPGVGARRAFERICSGAGLDAPSRYYSAEFRDHVNDARVFSSWTTIR